MVEWQITPGLTPYHDAVSAMETRVAQIIEGSAPELIWCLEHPPLYTAGTSAKPEDLREPERFEVFKTGRGGQYTYHGPGQRVVYVMLDLNKRGRDIRRFVTMLETWVITALADFNLSGRTHSDRVGVWIERPERASPIPGCVAEDKIAAIGVKVRKWVSFHGISINQDPDLSHFDGIVPCGIQDFGVTSLVDLGLLVSMEELDSVLRKSFNTIFA